MKTLELKSIVDWEWDFREILKSEWEKIKSTGRQIFNLI